MFFLKKHITRLTAFAFETVDINQRRIDIFQSGIKTERESGRKIIHEKGSARSSENVNLFSLFYNNLITDKKPQKHFTRLFFFIYRINVCFFFQPKDKLQHYLSRFFLEFFFLSLSFPLYFPTKCL